MSPTVPTATLRATLIPETCTSCRLAGQHRPFSRARTIARQRRWRCIRCRTMSRHDPCPRARGRVAGCASDCARWRARDAPATRAASSAPACACDVHGTGAVRRARETPAGLPVPSQPAAARAPAAAPARAAARAKALEPAACPCT